MRPLLYVTDARRTGVFCAPPDGDTTLYLHDNELDFVPVTGLHQPEGITFDSKGSLYVSDITLDKIVGLETDGNQANFATAVGWDGPWGLAFDAADNLYVADSNNRVVKVDAAGNFVAEVGTGHAWPCGVAIARRSPPPVGATTPAAVRRPGGGSEERTGARPGRRWDRRRRRRRRRRRW